MLNDTTYSYPTHYEAIEEASKLIGFSMPSDGQTGALLQTLVASKPKASVLEIGTGTGLATAWILAGMDATSHLISIDNETSYQAIAQDISWSRQPVATRLYGCRRLVGEAGQCYV